MSTNAQDAEPQPLLDTNTFSNLQRRCDELEKINSACVQDHTKLHGLFMDLAADFKELATEYDAVYKEYDRIVEEHEGLTVEHGKLAARYHELQRRYERNIQTSGPDTASSGTPVNLDPPPYYETTTSIPTAVWPVLTAFVNDTPEERHRNSTVDNICVACIPRTAAP
ncbi:hypothetical protein K438DRAFT_1998508 [Mycena galopus ATCC 62051]|nr:hypothetical protein K438DRAFT_1998508 [Mycena galopus ATCC 62051]